MSINTFLSKYYLLQATPSGYQDIQIVVIILQFIIAISILNVWVLQYRTIAGQFKEFNLPDWVRNVVGVTKGLLCIMLIAGIWVYQLAVIAGAGIAVLMGFAAMTHIRAKDPVSKIIPAVVLCVLSIVVAIMCYRYKFRG